jgi:hypothetical protein
MAPPSQIIEPDEAAMTPSVRALWQTIRDSAARIEAAKTAPPQA